VFNALLNQLKDLINEAGSSAILRERLNLAFEKFSFQLLQADHKLSLAQENLIVSEKQRALLDAHLAEAEGQIAALKEMNSQLEKQHRQLQQQLDALKHKKPPRKPVSGRVA